jgi:hypothetical protein
MTPEGSWERTVSAAPVEWWNDTWALTLKNGDGLELTMPTPGPDAPSDDAGYTVDGMYRVDGNVLTVDAFVGDVCAGNLGLGTYEWRVTGGRLELEPRNEPCAQRAAVLSGTWAPAP